MTSHSSISSSSELLQPPRAAATEALRPAPATQPLDHEIATGWRRLPTGAFAAVLLVIALHLLCAFAVYPGPMPRRDIRRKIIPLTAGARPQVLLAGDSRAECGLMPSRVAAALNLDERDVINIATPACESAGAVAAYREFHDRFADHPIMVLSVSVVGMNDDASEDMIGDETLWSVGLLHRWRLVGPKRALSATFLPEKELIRRNVLEPLLMSWDFSKATAAQGFHGARGALPNDPNAVPRTLNYLQRSWFGNGDIEGIRWALFQRELEYLQAAGVQVVILSPPQDPAITRGQAGTPMEAIMARYHANLASLASRLGIPLLCYNADMAAVDEPRELFADYMHLNTHGAEWLSTRCANDLHDLVEQGAIRLSATP